MWLHIYSMYNYKSIIGCDKCGLNADAEELLS